MDEEPSIPVEQSDSPPVVSSDSAATDVPAIPDDINDVSRKDTDDTEFTEKDKDTEKRSRAEEDEDEDASDRHRRKKKKVGNLIARNPVLPYRAT